MASSYIAHFTQVSMRFTIDDLNESIFYDNSRQLYGSKPHFRTTFTVTNRLIEPSAYFTKYSIVKMTLKSMVYSV